MIRRYESLLILLIMCVSVKRSKKTQQQKNDIKIPIIAAVGAFIMFVLAVVVLLVCRAWRKKLSQGNRTEINKTDENPTYGTYSRGCEEDGVYGDGDKVYVNDANDYYASE